jgi:hypothetical protein
VCAFAWIYQAVDGELELGRRKVAAVALPASNTLAAFDRVLCREIALRGERLPLRQEREFCPGSF